MSEGGGGSFSQERESTERRGRLVSSGRPTYKVQETKKMNGKKKTARKKKTRKGKGREKRHVEVEHL